MKLMLNFAKIYTWMRVNKLSLNIEKDKFHVIYAKVFLSYYKLY